MQFSLKTLLIVVTLVAVLCGIAFALPHLVGAIVLGLSLLFAPALLVSGAVYIRGNWQAFCVGGATISIFSMPVMYLNYSFHPIYSGSSEDDAFIEMKVTMAVLWGLICFSGLLGIGMRYISRWINPVPPPPRSSVSSAVPPSVD